MSLITPEEAILFAQSLISEEQHDQLLRTKNLDFSFKFNDFRFRGNVSFQMGYYMVVLRLLSQTIPTLKDLRLPFIYEEITRV